MSKEQKYIIEVPVAPKYETLLKDPIWKKFNSPVNFKRLRILINIMGDYVHTVGLDCLHSLIYLSGVNVVENKDLVKSTQPKVEKNALLFLANLGQNDDTIAEVHKSFLSMWNEYNPYRQIAASMRSSLSVREQYIDHTIDFATRFPEMKFSTSPRLHEVFKGIIKHGKVGLANIASDSNHLPAMQWLCAHPLQIPLLHLPDPNGASTLHGAACNGNIKIMEVLIKAGVKLSLSKTGETVLHYATRSNDPSVVEYCINELKLDINAKDRYQNTALGFAIKFSKKDSHFHIVEYLVNTLKMDIFQIYPDDGRSLLSWAAAGNNPKIVELLISHGLSPQIPCRGNKNALDYALINNCTDVIEVLVTNGMSIDPALMHPDTGSCEIKPAKLKEFQKIHSDYIIRCLKQLGIDGFGNIALADLYKTADGSESREGANLREIAQRRAEAAVAATKDKILKPLHEARGIINIFPGARSREEAINIILIKTEGMDLKAIRDYFTISQKKFSDPELVNALQQSCVLVSKVISLDEEKHTQLSLQTETNEFDESQEIEDKEWTECSSDEKEILKLTPQQLQIEELRSLESEALYEKICTFDRDTQKLLLEDSAICQQLGGKFFNRLKLSFLTYMQQENLLKQLSASPAEDKELKEGEGETQNLISILQSLLAKNTIVPSAPPSVVEVETEEYSDQIEGQVTPMTDMPSDLPVSIPVSDPAPAPLAPVKVDIDQKPDIQKRDDLSKSIALLPVLSLITTDTVRKKKVKKQSSKVPEAVVC